jgi:hypothetical protein
MFTQKRFSKVSAKKGFVACFDILGYRAIQPRVAFETWEGLVDEFVKSRNNARKIAQMISVHLFGDSIFVFAPLQSESIFTSYCRMAFWKAFEAGMPLRGAISGGEYFESFKFGPVYSGIPIVEAHDFQEALEVSACVVAPSALRWLPIVQPNDPVFKRLSVPMKGDKKENLFVVKPYREVPSVKVIKAFSAHGKPIGPREASKLNNTIELFSPVSLQEVDSLTRA